MGTCEQGLTNGDMHFLRAQQLPSLQAYMSNGLCVICQDQAREAQEKADLRRIILTTETAHNLPVSERLEIVTAEVVIGMHLFKDIATAFGHVRQGGVISRMA